MPMFKLRILNNKKVNEKQLIPSYELFFEGAFDILI